MFTPNVPDFDSLKGDTVPICDLIARQRLDNTVLTAKLLELRIRNLRQTQHIKELEAYISQLTHHKN